MTALAVDSVKDLAPQVARMLTELRRRAQRSAMNRKYLDGAAPVPKAVESARMTRAYGTLMGMSQAPWASVVVDSVLDRLEIGGIRTGNRALDDKLWDAWRAAELDVESKLAHHSALADGRVFATVWPGEDGRPEVVFDSAGQMIVEYVEGRHKPRHRVAALRHWTDDGDGKQRLTLYHRDFVWKFIETDEKEDAPGRFEAGGVWWEPRVETYRGLEEEWPLPNPYGIVTVVEIMTNRRLVPGRFAHARGEFEHCWGLLDRISLLTFLGLVVAVWMGFPLRGVLGQKILRDDDGNKLPPFAAKPDEVVQFESPDAKVFQLDAADRRNLSIFGELAQLAYATKTPGHYFPMDSGWSNISADAVRAFEGSLMAKVDGIHKPQMGGGWEEVVRLLGLMMDQEIIVPPTTEVVWVPRESRSLAEAADAAAKLKEILPWQIVAERYLGLGQDAIRRAEAEAATSVLGQLFEQAATDTVASAAAAGDGAETAGEPAPELAGA